MLLQGAGGGRREPCKGGQLELAFVVLTSSSAAPFADVPVTLSSLLSRGAELLTRRDQESLLCYAGRPLETNRGELCTGCSPSGLRRCILELTNELGAAMEAPGAAAGPTVERIVSEDILAAAKIIMEARLPTRKCREQHRPWVRVPRNRSTACAVAGPPDSRLSLTFTSCSSTSKCKRWRARPRRWSAGAGRALLCR